MASRIRYTVKRSKKARRMRLAVYCDGSIVVTAPVNVQETIIQKIVREKSQWLLSKIAFFAQFKDQPVARYSYEDYLKHKDKAYRLVVDRINFFNKKYKFHYNKINIKNQKTRWGSCSKKGNLNFNYKIAFLPQQLSDYIIVHELCHLKEFNHSRKFWNLVGRSFSEYKDVKKELRKYSVSLN